MKPVLSSWEIVAHTTGWKPEALRNRETLKKIEALQELKHEITESQRQQLIDRGYVRPITYGDIAIHCGCTPSEAQQLDKTALRQIVMQIREHRGHP